MRNLLKTLMIIIFIGLLLGGCAGAFKGFGTIYPDQKATRDFEAFQINPAFNYFYSGSEVYPNALIGIDKKYRLEPADFWKNITPTQKEFRALVKQMQDRAMTIGQSQFGFRVLDDREQPIGVWYSILDAATSVKMIDERTVLIHTPDFDTYMKHEKENDAI